MSVYFPFTPDRHIFEGLGSDFPEEDKSPVQQPGNNIPQGWKTGLASSSDSESYSSFSSSDSSPGTPHASQRTLGSASLAQVSSSRQEINDIVHSTVFPRIGGVIFPAGLNSDSDSTSEDDIFRFELTEDKKVPTSKPSYTHSAMSEPLVRRQPTGVSRPFKHSSADAVPATPLAPYRRELMPMLRGQPSPELRGQPSPELKDLNNEGRTVSSVPSRAVPEIPTRKENITEDSEFQFEMDL